jgi:hypothetical protein
MFGIVCLFLWALGSSPGPLLNLTLFIYVPCRVSSAVSELQTAARVSEMSRSEALKRYTELARR